MCSANDRQRGVALISVLLIVAILMAVTSRLLATHNLVINQHQNTFEQNQALHYVLGAETLARQALYEDFTQSGPGLDHQGELWAQPVMPFELDEGGFLEAQLRDLHGCMNLNAVIGAGSATHLERLQRLSRNLGIDQNIAESWKDWIDADMEVTGFGAEDNEYLLAQPPYRTPNRPVTGLSELFLLQGADREQLALLLPHVCLLPHGDSRVNINTADAQTLAALDAELSLAITEPIAAEERRYDSVEGFLEAHAEFASASDVLSVTSEHFLLHAQAQVGSSSVSLESLLYRDPDNGRVTVIKRDFGKLFRTKLSATVEEP